MDMTIKHIKSTLLLFSAFLTLSIYSGDQDSVGTYKIPTSINAEIAETFKTYKSEENIDEMAKKYKLEKYEKKFIKDFQKQRLNYLTRKCINLCADEPFNEKWRYKTEAREKNIDETKILEANDLYKNPDVRKRFQACFTQFSEKNNHDAKQRLDKLKETLDNNKAKLKQIQIQKTLTEESLFRYSLGLSL